MKKSFQEQPNLLAASETSNLLMASVFLSMEDIEKTLNMLNKHPEKQPVISVKLRQQLSLYKELTDISNIKKQVKARIEEWSLKYGDLDMTQYAYVSKTFGITISDLFSKQISPRDIYDLLNCYVSGQDKYKRKLSVAFSLHLLKNSPSAQDTDLPKSSLLVCGPSGSGKTYAVQTLAKNFNKPVVIIHCNSLVPSGIVGSTIPNHFTALLVKGYTPKELEESLVLLDEVDKPLQNPEFCEALQNEFLSLSDDQGEIKCKVTFDNNSEYVSIPTKSMMFVYTGVFDGIFKLKTADGIGFCHQNRKDNPTELEADDLLAYGMKRELVGRIQSFTTVEHLTLEEMLNVLNAPLESPLLEYLNYFRLSGVNLIVTEEAKQYLAEIAVNRKLGVRGLKSILNELLNEEMFSWSGGRIEITRNYIDNHISIN